MKKFTTKLFVFLFAVCSLQVMAQKTPPEFSAQIAGGISTLCFQPSVSGKTSVGFSSDVGGGFTGFFGPRWGIHVGVNLGLMNVKTKVDSLKAITNGMFDKINIIDGKTDLPYDLHTYLNYTEIYKSMYVSIPIMFQFQTRQKQYWNWRQNKKPAFYAMGGIKVFFLVDNKYETRVSELTNKAYYTELKNWAATQAFAGLGTLKGEREEGWNAKDKLDFGVMAMFAFETGIKWRIDKTIFLYTGAYLDVALNDPNKKNRIEYRNEGEMPNKEIRNLTLYQISNRTTALVVGIKLRFAFIKSQGPY